MARYIDGEALSNPGDEDPKLHLEVARALAEYVWGLSNPGDEDPKLHLGNVLATLSRPERDVLGLYYIDGLSFEAMGRRLDLSRQTVRGIYAQGMKHLKRSLEGPPGGPLRYDDGPAH